MVVLWMCGGLFVGFVLNYLADVLPLTRKFSHPLWWPLSWRGVGRYLVRPRVLAILVTCASCAAFLCCFPPADFSTLVLAALLAYFLLVAVIDFEHRLVMHPVSYFGAVLMGVIGFHRHGLVETLLGGLAGFGFMLALYFLGDWVGRLLAKARKEKWDETVLGFGDVNLAGVIGLLMGWPAVLLALFLGMLAAGLFSAFFLLNSVLHRSYRAFSTIPYAPFLCLGAVGLILFSIYRT
jgi:prepilin signal peptidase PulO-like enzyme (type II secretory pathway)